MLNSSSCPTVSVVIPAHNKAGTIGSTIESVVHQTFQDIEIIVVDDGSTDDTQEKVTVLNRGIRYIRQQKAGVSAARNRGGQEAIGEFIAFLDGDDLWLPYKLEVQVSFLQQHSEIGAVQCSAYLVNNHLDVIEARRCQPMHDTLLDFLFFRNLPALGSTLLIRKECLQALGGFGTDLVILEDWDLACRLAKVSLLRSLPDYLVLYRQHSGNRSRDVGIHIEPGFRSIRRFFSDSSLDFRIRKQETRVWARFYAMLAGGYVQNRQWKEGLYWAWRALYTSPNVSNYALGMPLRWFQRIFIARQKISLIDQFPFEKFSSSAV